MKLHSSIINTEKLFTIKSAVIDACSIIYSFKCDYYNILTKNINLHTIPEIIKELNNQLNTKNITICNEKLIVESIPQSTNDNKLITFAYIKKMPIISDDKNVLKLAKKLNLDFYNSLMVLNILFAKNIISRTQYQIFKNKIIKTAYYSEEIIKIAEKYFNILN